MLIGSTSAKAKNKRLCKLKKKINENCSPAAHLSSFKKKNKTVLSAYEFNFFPPFLSFLSFLLGFGFKSEAGIV